MTRLSLCFLLIYTFFTIVAASRIKDMIYMPIDGVAACFRRHNGTHQFGCSSKMSGSVGVVHVIDNELDLAWVEHNATAGPYSVVLRFPMFTRDTLIRLKKTGNINGVLLADNITSDTSHYSPDDTCPNRYSGLENTCDDVNPWNPYGSSLLLEDWPFPMFFLPNDTVRKEIESCYQKHNAHDLENQQERSLCALEMKSFMNAAVDSGTCLRRSSSMFNSEIFCDPLGDRNIHWPLASMEYNIESVIMVVARLDANSLYNDLVPGAQSAVTGLATLLTTAYYLKQLNPLVHKTNVVFSILNGESMDYIGSSRLVYDLKEGQFQALGGKNLTLDHISAVIELGQLGKRPEGKYYLHASNYDKFKLVTKLAANLSAEILSNSVPPASIQRFLREKAKLPAVVIANHKGNFQNHFYQSMLDDSRRLGFDEDSVELFYSLANVSFSLANELYRTVTGNSPPVNKEADTLSNQIKQILTCYLVSANCDLFNAALPPDTKVSDKVLPLYVSVARVDNPSTFFTGQLLKLLTGTEVHVQNASECYDQHFIWINGFKKTGLCINSTVNYSSAISPAFIIEGYNMKSGVYSTWTESVWQTFSVRMFLKPPAATERFSLILGGSVTAISFVLVWFINSRASILFDSSRTIDL